MFPDHRYESPLEAIFDWEFAKYIAKGVTISPQGECVTMLGTFRLDFVITGKLKVGVELDGEEFHDEFRDECRDSIILGEKHVDVIYRFKGKDVYHNTADMLYLMSQCDPWLFSERGKTNLNSLSCRERTVIDPNDEMQFVTVSHFDDFENEHFRLATIVRRSVRSIHRHYWQNLYQFALEKKPSNLGGMIAAREAWQAEQL